MAFQLDLQKIAYTPTVFEVDLQKLAYTGAPGFGIDLQRIAYTGTPYGLIATNAEPESGEVVGLTFTGAPGVSVTWRVVSGPAAVIAASGMTASAFMPAVSAATDIVLGARQGTNPEVTVALVIAPTPHYTIRGAGVGVALPSSLHLIR